MHEISLIFASFRFDYLSWWVCERVYMYNMVYVWIPFRFASILGLQREIALRSNYKCKYRMCIRSEMKRIAELIIRIERTLSPSLAISFHPYLFIVLWAVFFHFTTKIYIRINNNKQRKQLMCEHMKLWNEKPQKQLKPKDEELWAVCFGFGFHMPCIYVCVCVDNVWIMYGASVTPWNSRVKKQKETKQIKFRAWARARN